MKIVVDAMGGDFAPENVIAGVVDAIKEFKVHITLVGIEDRVKQELAKYSYPKDLIELVHAPDVVGMDEPAVVSLRQKKNSSISIGIRLLKQDTYDAFISAGNTGAVVAASTFNLGMIPGVDRPGIGILIPTLNGVALMVDVGANTSAKPEHLFQYALMAKAYAQEVMNVASPSIGLLNIGAEEGKGTDFERECHELMTQKVKGFIGNLEANEVYTGKCDCIICDGFVGNVVLKVSEGLVEAAGQLLKREIKKDPLAMVGAFLMKPRMRQVKKLADYSEYGGAPLLGVNGLVMISHGRSSPKAIKNAIRATMREVEHGMLAKLKEEVAQP